MKIRTSRLLALPAAALLTLLAACTGGGPDTPSSAPPASADSVTVDINPQPRTLLAEGGELRVPITKWGEQWNPLHEDGVSGNQRQIQSSLMPRLFNYDADGNPAPNPDYLTAVHASGENPQVVTYTLNPSARWGNGRPIGVQDFVANWEACNGQNVSFDCKSTKHLSEVESIEEGANPEQVVVTYKGAYDDWPSTFFYLAPAGGVQDPETFNEGWTDLTKISDWLGGPFVVSEFDQDADVLIETANPDWWGETPKLAQLTFRKYRQSDQSEAFQDHQLDVADISDDSDESDTINALPDAEVRVAVDPENQERELIATRTALANYGAFGESTVTWPDVGYLSPNA